MKISRDSNSGAIINLDEDGYNAAKLRKQAQKRRIKLEQENNELKNIINNLSKRMLQLENKYTKNK